jgi:hypothetical protein
MGQLRSTNTQIEAPMAEPMAAPVSAGCSGSNALRAITSAASGHADIRQLSNRQRKPTRSGQRCIMLATPADMATFHAKSANGVAMESQRKYTPARPSVERPREQATTSATSAIAVLPSAVLSTSALGRGPARSPPKARKIKTGTTHAESSNTARRRCTWGRVAARSRLAADSTRVRSSEGGCMALFDAGRYDRRRGRGFSQYQLGLWHGHCPIHASTGGRGIRFGDLAFFQSSARCERTARGQCSAAEGLGSGGEQQATNCGRGTETKGVFERNTPQCLPGAACTTL